MRNEFVLYPAIDILGGKCVRLLRGEYEHKTEYSDHPVAVAERWLAAGASFLHVVDLDAARTGAPTNEQVIRDVVLRAAAAGAKVQVGGGIRTHAAIERWLAAGVARCVIGTAALQPGWMEEAVRRFGGEALVVGLDGRDGKLAVHGWTDQTDVSVVDLARQFSALGVRYALVTDVARDGTLQGANLELAQAVQAQGLAAIASGGIRDVTDVLAARRAGLAGAVAGRALYDGTLDLHAAYQALKEEAAC